eukprot:TRINITY_DN59446_c0_g1_i1.p1 TRINITY_DN59446_c0_g1~~TRINITY_DN59446_c0_g1_i1.p1  ORF type:complete len:1295 (-),score=267.50 TRINITY_DN59446_c0_g1_i1:53-3841(-)
MGVHTPLEQGFEVVHTQVAVRSSTSVQSRMCGSIPQGSRLQGCLAQTEDGVEWLRLSEDSIKAWRLNVPVGGAFVLIHGRTVGLGELLRPVQLPQLQGSDGAPPKKVAPAQPEAEPPPPNARRDGPVGNFLVVHSKVVVRQAPSTDARFLGVRLQGAAVTGTPFVVGGAAWLQLRVRDGDGGWMLVDGASVGLGTLLQRLADLAEDALAWAQQQQFTDAGKAVVWTAETEAEVRRLEAEARSQVAPMRPLCVFPAVLDVLHQHGFLSDEDARLEPEGVGRTVLRALLRPRLGLLVLGEETSESQKTLPLEAVEFDKFMQESVLPVAPFPCLFFHPDDRPQRLLVLLHGSYVRSDDLVGEAEVLQGVLPATTIVLPEAPVLVDAASGVRAWWPLPKGGKDRLAFKAPELAVQRLVATASWLGSQFGQLQLVIGGFSQGAMLVAQALHRLMGSTLLQLKGALFLSGLAAAFEVPPGLRCLAIHGDEDQSLPLSYAEDLLANHSRLRSAVDLEIVKGLGHAISDAVLDRVAAFCEEAAPVAASGTLASRHGGEEPALIQEANQAKLLRWVKKMSRGVSMFDDERFMSHLVCVDMPGLPAGSPELGGGLVKYELHNVAEGCRGLVVLFHGKLHDLQEGTRPLIAAYHRLKLSVCVVDYRQKFSQFCVDATLVLEAIETLSASAGAVAGGNRGAAVIVHGVGCGAIHALHLGIASHSYPRNLRRRLRLLVLDGAVANFRCLPPTPTGCIAVDPIGNDEKLKYIGMPLCILGGDDGCCGYATTQKHFAVLQRGAEMHVLPERVFSMDSGPALMDASFGDRLSPELYKAVSKALDPAAMAALEAEDAEANRGECQGRQAASQRFFEDVFDEAEAEGIETLAGKLKEQELLDLCDQILARADALDVQQRLWEIRRMRSKTNGGGAAASARDRELPSLQAFVYEPVLKQSCAGFTTGAQAAVAELDAVLAIHGRRSSAVAEKQQALLDKFDFRLLDAKVLRAERDRSCSYGVSLEQLYKVVAESQEAWDSDEMQARALLVARIEAGSPALQARTAVRQLSEELSGRMAQKLGLPGAEASAAAGTAKLNEVFGYFLTLDPYLKVYSGQMQVGVMHFSQRLAAQLKEQDVAAAGSGSSAAAQTSNSSGRGAAAPSASAPAACEPRPAGASAHAAFEPTPATAVAETTSAPVPSTDGKQQCSVVIHIDQDLGLSPTVQVPSDMLIRGLIDKLASFDVMGEVKPQDIKLCCPGGPPLADSVRVVDCGPVLEVCES